MSFAEQVALVGILAGGFAYFYYQDRIYASVGRAIDRLFETRPQARGPSKSNSMNREMDPETAASLERSRKGFWYPNRRQWWVIWIAYVIAVFINGDKMSLSRLRSDDPEGVVTAFMIVGAALLVWRLCKSKVERGW